MRHRIAPCLPVMRHVLETSRSEVLAWIRTAITTNRNQNDMIETAFGWVRLQGDWRKTVPVFIPTLCLSFEPLVLLKGRVLEVHRRVPPETVLPSLRRRPVRDVVTMDHPLMPMLGEITIATANTRPVSGGGYMMLDLTLDGAFVPARPM